MSDPGALARVTAEWEAEVARRSALQVLPLDAPAFLVRASWYDRNLGPAMLFDAYFGRELAPDALPGVLPDVWTGAEWPSQAMSTALWIDLFREAGFCSDSGHQPPTDPLTIFRGATPRYARGMAWTTDHRQADWFANRWTARTGRATYVYVATVAPAAVLAMIDGRSEHEVVVDPALLPRPVTRAK